MRRKVSNDKILQILYPVAVKGTNYDIDLLSNTLEHLRMVSRKRNPGYAIISEEWTTGPAGIDMFCVNMKRMR
jgi:hypothetical protein